MIVQRSGAAPFSFPQSGEKLRSSARKKQRGGVHFEEKEGGVQAGQPGRRGTISEKNETNKQSPSQIICGLATNHLGQDFEFYNDLVKDRIVLIHLMSIHHNSKYPVARNLIRLQQMLGDRLGDDIFIHSITTQPQIDTTARLRSFARRQRARNGWQFLTGNLHSIQAIQNCLFVHSTAPTDSIRFPRQSDTDHEHKDCSLGLIRYGNDALGIWGSVPGKADPKMIVERLSWLQPQPKPKDGRLVRGGPFPNQQYAIRLTPNPG